MIYLAFDPGKTGAACGLSPGSRTPVLLTTMPVIKVKERKKTRHEDDEPGILAIYRHCMELDDVTAVIEAQQDRPGQRRGGDSAVGIFNLLHGIAIGIGVRHVTVHPTTWTHHCYRGMVESCLKCGTVIGNGVKIVREKAVIRQSGKHKGQRAVEEGRFCPKCLASIDGKLRSIAYCRSHFPDVSLLATPGCSVPHEGIPDAICLASYACEMKL